MSIKKILFILVVFVGCFSFGQNKKILFGFAELPQTLMLNPGAETNFRFHVGVPLLSGLSLEVGATEGKISDLFLNDQVSFNTKFENFIAKLSPRDYMSFNTQIEVLNGGYRMNKKAYLSFGFYEEIDMIGYNPKDIVEFLYYGNQQNLSRPVQFSQINYRAEVLGVLHAGISYKLNKKTTIGSRFKLYSGGIQTSSNNNSGYFTTTVQGNNIYRHHFTNVNVNSYSSGLYNDDGQLDIDAGEIFNNTILSKNIGIGVDVGFTYHYSPQIEITGSILDVGFVRYSKKIGNTSISGSHQIDGIGLVFDGGNTDYWAQLDSELRTNLPTNTNKDSYVAWRPIKMYGGIKYGYGEARTEKECYEPYKEYYKNSVGLQLFAATRPLATQTAATVFFERSFNEQLFTKLTYTVDAYSFSNVGLGISAKVGKFNVYGLVDNIFKMTKLEETSYISIQFGMNLIFD
ncbi:MAG: hypothetical protein HWD85_12160 [Flavobacteriaceae bacterium]|nr:hypothetical protein [Flavobacteriaceae bacterium]